MHRETWACPLIFLEQTSGYLPHTIVLVLRHDDAAAMMRSISSGPTGLLPDAEHFKMSL